MHERFSRALEVYHDLAKTKLELQQESASASPKRTSHTDELADLEAAIRFHERNNSTSREQEPKVQRRIFAMQEAKAKIMQKLHEDLDALDHPEKNFVPEKSSYAVTADKEGRLFLKGKQITEGMLLTDGEWGIRYHLDSSVPHSIREIYLIEEAKRNVRALLDEQIVEDQLGSKQTHEFKKDVYGSFKEMKGREDEVGGWVAERLIKTFFKRLAIDFDLDLDLIETDVYEDVEHKIDFVIRRKSRVRGVDVEAREEHQDLGVQFTMRHDPVTLEHKRRQIDRVKGSKEGRGLRVEDIILVSLPLGGIRRLLSEWSETKQPGGPTERLPLKEKKLIFNNVLHGILSPSEIEAQWRIVSGESEKT